MPKGVGYGAKPNVDKRKTSGFGAGRSLKDSIDGSVKPASEQDKKRRHVQPYQTGARG